MRMFSLLLMAAMVLAAPAAAQIGLPQPSLPMPALGPAVGRTVGSVERAAQDVQREAEDLARQRVRSIDRLLRQNRDAVELDRQGAPARRGELLVLDAGEADLEAARRSGSRFCPANGSRGWRWSSRGCACPHRWTWQRLRR